MKENNCWENHRCLLFRSAEKIVDTRYIRVKFNLGYSNNLLHFQSLLFHYNFSKLYQCIAIGITQLVNGQACLMNQCIDKLKFVHFIAIFSLQVAVAVAGFEPSTLG
jgi:hypothetical protein